MIGSGPAARFSPGYSGKQHWKPWTFQTGPETIHRRISKRYTDQESKLTQGRLRTIECRPESLSVRTIDWSWAYTEMASRHLIEGPFGQPTTHQEMTFT